MSVEWSEMTGRRLLKLGAADALGAASLAVLALVGGCSEEDQAQETPTAQDTQEGAVAARSTLAETAAPTPEPTKENPADVTQQPATATPEALATGTPAREPTEDSPPTATAIQPTVPETSTPPWFGRYWKGYWVAPGEKDRQIVPDPTGRFVEGELIIRFKDGLTDQEKAEVLAQHDIDPTNGVARILLGGSFLVLVDPDRTEAILEGLNEDPDVEWAERDPIAVPFGAYTIPATTSTGTAG